VRCPEEVVVVSKIVLFELNECPWRVILDHAERRPNGALATILRRSESFATQADERVLSPWITWPTLHRGIADRSHGVVNINQDLREVDRAYPSLWSLAQRAGRRVGVFGSMHSHPLPIDRDNVAFHVPDPFAPDSDVVPARVRPFQEFNLVMSRASGRNVSTKVPWRAAVDLAGALPRLGLRPRTLAAVAGQLVAERRERWRTVRRRTFQAVLGFDVFMRLLADEQPDFSTFFTNHVAATMHRFWAAAYPGDYAEYGYPDEWRRTYAGEIAWAMDALDAMLARLVAWTQLDARHELWIATSMGQAATRADNRVSTQLYLEDVDAFMSRFGFGPGRYQRHAAMLPRVIVAVDPAEADTFARRTADVQLAPDHALVVEPLGGGRFCLAVPVLQDHGSDECRVDGRPASLLALGFRNAAIEDESGQTAYHVPRGALMVHRRGARGRIAEPVRTISTLDVAPMMLARLDVAAPAYMRKDELRRPVAPHAGRDLVGPRSLPARPRPRAERPRLPIDFGTPGADAPPTGRIPRRGPDALDA